MRSRKTEEASHRRKDEKERGEKRAEVYRIGEEREQRKSTAAPVKNR